MMPKIVNRTVMEKIYVPYFGEIKIDKSLVEQNFEKYVKFNDNLIELNLIYETAYITISDLMVVKDFLYDFEKHLSNATQAIINDYEKNGRSKKFIQTHLDALNPLGKEILKETLSKDLDLDEYFLRELELNFVYIFPDDLDEFIKFNFRVSEEFTDEFLFVRFGRDFVIKEISTEY
jgi:hypothetical protein